MRKTKFFPQQESRWFLIDARGKVLGRLATRIARILQGKHKPTYTPNFLSGDKVVVINAKDVRVTGKKMKDKIYDKYSGYPDGRREITLEKLMEKNPTKALYLAVKGMLPKTTLGRKMLRSLKIYAGEGHTHQGQKPVKIEV